MKQMPRRKNVRIKKYDYSQNGYYYITICTKNKQEILSEITTVGVAAHSDKCYKEMLKRGEKMKLQGLTVIFIIIALPIILVLSYYISLQIDTINMQAVYNRKLLDSTKEAIEAFEINTVEWNEAFSTVADSKRRDIMASINTFTTSFANNIGIAGSSKEQLLTYIPAIAYTLYDGYYIYSPTETATVIKDKNGTAVYLDQDNGDLIDEYEYKLQDKGKILYKCAKEKESDGKYDGEPFTFEIKNAQTEYKHILKPFTAYSANYINDNSNINIVVNYTLDNYIKIYGKIDGTYITKSGYLIDTGDIKIKDNKIEKDNIKIKPENLSEQVLYYNKDGTAVCGVYDYIYEAKYNTKVYFDNDRPFQVNSNGVRTDLSDSTSTYKKLSIKTGDDTYTEIYQGLVDDKKEKWYTDETLTNEVKTDYDIDLKQDTSAINYYVESYIFSKWVENNLGDIQIEDIKLQDGEESEFTTKDPIFKNIEGEDSVFTKHKREVIKQVLIRNLNQAITSYSRNSEGEYQLPQLLETDWDKILTNVSITTFVQGIPIGMKYYNNYAIATSTSNKEYVNPDEIYLSNSSTYHMPYCEEFENEEFENNENIVGYKSIDYRLKKSSNTGEEYYKQGGNKEACYYCLIQRSLYEETENEKQQELQKTAYETALARERYVANPTT